MKTLNTTSFDNITGGSVATATTATAGSATGAAIGTAIAGPVGTIIGAAIGAGLGTAAGEAIDNNKQEIVAGLNTANQAVGASLLHIGMENMA